MREEGCKGDDLRAEHKKLAAAGQTCSGVLVSTRRFGHRVTLGFSQNAKIGTPPHVQVARCEYRHRVARAASDEPNGRRTLSGLYVEHLTCMQRPGDLD